MAESEVEKKVLKDEFFGDVVGAYITVQGFTNYKAPVTHEGVQDFIDRIRARGWKFVIERA